MDKFMPREKLSKKKQRELNAQRRTTWGGISPVTRTSANLKAYDRNKAKRWKRDGFDSLSCYFFKRDQAYCQDI